ncbi:hypothetical protein EST38_g7096 [Candolleomyces aberdarensis]|uniref:DRBM domain-containing protein n=1 Tax=Candolleomyces aberdarensis TaxID=2316362 RepID=A0A4Q2DFZ9_9AGAR|nr:hypothetical protein EST38_g7096 [Candolleomyces aberdarensis]
MSNGSCMRFNNATQRIFGETIRANVLVWETNDREKPWSAEARLVGNNGNDLLLAVGQASARKKQEAKDMAAQFGFEWLRAEYPSVNLSNI